MKAPVSSFSEICKLAYKCIYKKNTHINIPRNHFWVLGCESDLLRSSLYVCLLVLKVSCHRNSPFIFSVDLVFLKKATRLGPLFGVRDHLP